MLKGWTIVALMLILFRDCSNWINSTVSLFEPPAGQMAEQNISPTRRFVAQLWRCCDIYDYISGFDISDTQTSVRYRQNLRWVEGLHFLAGGIFFEWTPRENYLVIITDNRVTSHGCDELLVYTGDGSELVYTSLDTSFCSGHPEDNVGMTVIICDNDDILYSSSHFYRLIPSTGEVQRYEDQPECAA
jgi:hypothetical protein